MLPAAVVSGAKNHSISFLCFFSTPPFSYTLSERKKERKKGVKLAHSRFFLLFNN